MRRKIIQHSPTSLVITIPTQWAKRNNISRGSEIDLTEINEDLLITKIGKDKSLPLEADINISELDKTTVMHILRNLYRAGYDKITLRFDKDTLPYQKVGETYSITTLLHEETRKLLGYEITRERKNLCTIENISEGISEEVPTIVRRIHLLMIDIAESMLDLLSGADMKGFREIRDKHETIIRFINYCMRSGAKNYSRERYIDFFSFHNLANLDRIVHLLRSSAKYLSMMKEKPSEQLVDAMRLTVESLKLLNKFLFTKKSTIIKDMNNLRYSVERIIKTSHDLPNRPLEEVIVLFHIRAMHHLMLDICDVRGL